jgi:hypothetical protein
VIAVALQEWAAICDRLAAGRQILTVRKGGIHERGGGLFALEHDRFALLPTYLHQDASRVHADTPVPTDPSPGMHRIILWAEAVRIWKVTERRRLDAVADDLPWTAAELDARFAYKGQPFLFVVALRIHRLPAVLEIPDHPSYAGCRSWIPLRSPVDIAGSLPVLDDATFARRLALNAASLQP